MQKDLDTYLAQYHKKRPHQGRGMKGGTPEKAFTDGLQKKEGAKIKPTKTAA